MSPKIIETVEDVQTFVQSQLNDLLAQPGAVEVMGEIVDKMEMDGQYMTWGEKTRWVSKRVAVGIPTAILILKGLGYLFVLTWLPI